MGWDVVTHRNPDRARFSAFSPTTKSISYRECREIVSNKEKDKNPGRNLLNPRVFVYYSSSIGELSTAGADTSAGAVLAVPAPKMRAAAAFANSCPKLPPYC